MYTVTPPQLKHGSKKTLLADIDALLPVRACICTVRTAESNGKAKKIKETLTFCRIHANISLLFQGLACTQ